MAQGLQCLLQGCTLSSAKRSTLMLLHAAVHSTPCCRLLHNPLQAAPKPASYQHSLPQLPPAEEGEEEDAAAVEARPQAYAAVSAALQATHAADTQDALDFELKRQTVLLVNQLSFGGAFG